MYVYVIAIYYWHNLVSEIYNMTYAFFAALSFTCLNMIIYFFYIDKVKIKIKETKTKN